MTLTVAIIAPGVMGSGVGQRLAENKVTVLTSLAGRSEATVARAREAGMIGVADSQLAEADFLLSIVPPGEAVGLARRLAPTLRASNKKTVYVDCNAVSPPTAQEVADVIATTSCLFVDGAIIGGPPKPGSRYTTMYVSGQGAHDVARLNDYGLIVRVLDGPLTAASALKMSYAGITKGYTAIAAAMMLAATRGGTAEALKAELQESQPHLWASLMRQVPGMYSKAYRWVAELDEIANFVGKDHPEHAMFSAAARFYEEIAKDYDGGKQSSWDWSRVGPSFHEFQKFGTLVFE
jgi:3-hydroxyisobutyrate dehydrogenase-like beta-hydroxyacid dehydrogenase